MFQNDDPDRIALCPPWFPQAERKTVIETLESDWITTVGPNLPAFEREFSEILGQGCHSAALSSGTAALHLALHLLGVRAGDEVICPSFTFVASANAAVYQGAKPVFVDSERQSWNLCPELLEKALQKRAAAGRLPKAVIVVHIYGQSADLDAIAAVCDRYGVPLVEDAAEALGTQYKGAHVGLRGKLGIFSFNGNKMITTGGGGMLVSQDEGLIARARHLSFQGKAHEYDYVHEELAFNYRMSNVLAAIGRGQLQTLSERLTRKAWIHHHYESGFKEFEGLFMMPVATFGRPTHWLSIVTLAPALLKRVDRIDVIRRMAARKIQVRPVWYPMHLQPCFSGCESELNGVSADIHARSFCLPSGFDLNEGQQQRVVEEFMDVVRG